MYLQNKNSRSKKLLIVLPILLLLIVGAGLAFQSVRENRRETPDTNSDTREGIDYSPPTDEEIRAGDDIKKEAENREKNDNEPTKQKDNTTVIITDAGVYDSIVEVRAFMPDHYQDGTCTITITRESNSVSKSTPAYRDASTTICTNPLFARSEFAVAGDWQVTVTYSSNETQGTSAARTIRIE